MIFRTSSRRYPVSVLALLTAGALVLAGCSQQEGPPQMPPAQVGVLALQKQPVPLVNQATGRLSAYRSADVRARVAGVLLERTYKEGADVEKDEQLFQIDPAPLEAALQAARAQLAQARATHTNSKITAERARALRPKGAISQADLDNAEAAERTAAAAVQAATAGVEEARINLGYASVRAPIAGRAGKQQVTEGALVGQGSPTLLTTVQQVDPLYVNFSIPIDEVQELRAAQAAGDATLASDVQVQVQLPGGQPYAHAGTLDFTDMSVDPATGAVTLRALIPNPDHVLLPGMYTSLEVHRGTRRAWVIPQAAVLRDATTAYVLTVDGDNKVVRKDITTAGMRAGAWVVTGGVADGDHVVVRGVPKAEVGATVAPSLVSATDADAAPAPAAGDAPQPSGD